MELSPLELKTATKILRFIETLGSGPIQILDENDEIYYAKTTDIIGLPNNEMICELFVNYFAKVWGLKIAEPCLIKIPKIVVDDYLIENGVEISKRYLNTDFDNLIFFGVKSISNIIENERYIKGLHSRKEYNKFNKPLDLIKIGVLDLWVGNMDRKANNPNILITESLNSKFDFIPIDHALCLGYQRQLKKINSSHLHIEDRDSILSTGLSATILKYSKKRDLVNLNLEIKECMNSCLKNSSFIFSQIPSEWGFSKKAKENITFVLSQEERNNSLSSSFIRFKPGKK